jgi:hypothetical protein
VDVKVVYYKILYALLVSVDVDQGRHEDALRTVRVLADTYLTHPLRRRYYRIEIPGTSLQSNADATRYNPRVSPSRSPSSLSISTISSPFSRSSSIPSSASFYILL